MKKGRPPNRDGYEKFVVWTALPGPLREPQTQKDLAVVLGVPEATLSDWKKREGFWEEVMKNVKDWARDKTPNVVMGLYRRAVKTGDAKAATLWIKWLHDWQEKIDAPTERPIIQIINFNDSHHPPQLRSENQAIPIGDPAEPIEVQVVDHTSQGG